MEGTNASIIIEPPPEFAAGSNQQPYEDELNGQAPRIIQTTNSTAKDDIEQNDKDCAQEVLDDRTIVDTDLTKGKKLLSPPQAGYVSPIRKLSLNSLLGIVIAIVLALKICEYILSRKLMTV